MSDDQENSANPESNQDNQEGGAASTQEAAAAPDPVVPTESGRPEHTAEMAENQDKKPGKPGPGGPSGRPALRPAEAALVRRISDIEYLLIEKEAYQMAYVFQKIPKPYYSQWKSEGNEITALMVSLKHRQAEMRRRKVG